LEGVRYEEEGRETGMGIMHIEAELGPLSPVYYSNAMTI
jgi:hypothetical protein